jgi:hypothetical protein
MSKTAILKGYPKVCVPQGCVKNSPWAKAGNYTYAVVSTFQRL